MRGRAAQPLHKAGKKQAKLFHTSFYLTVLIKESNRVTQILQVILKSTVELALFPYICMF